MNSITDLRKKNNTEDDPFIKMDLYHMEEMIAEL